MADELLNSVRGEELPRAFANLESEATAVEDAVSGQPRDGLEDQANDEPKGTIQEVNG